MYIIKLPFLGLLRPTVERLPFVLVTDCWLWEERIGTPAYKALSPHYVYDHCLLYFTLTTFLAEGRIFIAIQYYICLLRRFFPVISREG